LRIIFIIGDIEDNMTIKNLKFKIFTLVKFFMNGKKHQQGSTLVELLIALSIFAIFITIAIGGFLQSLTNQRLVLKLISATDNMSLTIEQIMREMRVGTSFMTLTDGIRFDRPDSDDLGMTVMRRVTYTKEQSPWDSTKFAIKREVQDLDDNGIPSGPPISDYITSNNVNVAYFNTTAQAEYTPGPCRINMVFGVKAEDKKVSITNYIQTTVSSRIFSDICE